LSHLVREELQGDKAVQLYVPSFVDHTHSALAELLDDAVVMVWPINDEGLSVRDHIMGLDCALPVRADRINQCQGLLRVIAIGSRQLNGERSTMTVADLDGACSLARSVGLGLSAVSKNSAHGTTLPQRGLASAVCRP
jgi:hypothetical protein